MKIGDTIIINYMKDEPQYTGKTGVIQSIEKDPWGDTTLHGTWGGCSVLLEYDDVSVIENGD